MQPRVLTLSTRRSPLFVWKAHSQGAWGRDLQTAPAAAQRLQWFFLEWCWICCFLWPSCLHILQPAGGQTLKAPDEYLRTFARGRSACQNLESSSMLAVQEAAPGAQLHFTCELQQAGS